MTRREKMAEMMRRYGVNREDLCFAKLVTNDIDPVEAYMVIYRVTTKDQRTSLKRYLAGNPKLEILIAALKRGVDDIPIEEKKPSHDHDDIDLRSKEGMLDALERAYRDEDDPKKQADILGKIADLQRLKDEENKESRKLVHYYLPLRCDVCPYKAAYIPD